MLEPDLRKPTEIKKEMWVHAYKGNIPIANTTVDLSRIGKWLIFVSTEFLDDAWEKVRQATVEGLLGTSAKSATMMTNAYALAESFKVICVYTDNYENDPDVRRVLVQLRQLGFRQRLNYKTDKATYNGEMAKNKKGPTSYWTSPQDTTEMRRPKGWEK
jgi:hypothetical protein